MIALNWERISRRPVQQAHIKVGADCFDPFIRVNRDVKCVAACMLSPPYLDSGDGAQKLENHIAFRNCNW